MFDIGFFELLLIGIITLIIVGPERLPAIARKVGSFVAKANQFIGRIKDDIDNEIKIDNLKEEFSLPKEMPTVNNIIQESKQAINDINTEINTQPSNKTQDKNKTDIT
jgi:sec-independent protein translocase protein TatB